MPRTRRAIVKARCTICRHPERSRIELAHVSGVSLDHIAAKFGATRDAIWRHARNHMTEDDRAMYLADVNLTEVAERANSESLSLLDYLSIVRATLMCQMQMAAGLNDRHATAVLAGRLTEVLKEIGKLTGELLRMSPTHVTNNTAVFLASPHYASLERMLIDRLAPFPDALASVVDGLRSLESQPTDVPRFPPAEITLHAN